ARAARRAARARALGEPGDLRGTELPRTPAGPEPGGATQGSSRVAADPERRPGPLRHARRHHDVAERHGVAIEPGHVVLPGGGDGAHVLVGDAAAALEVGAERLELGLQMPAADAEDQAA